MDPKLLTEHGWKTTAVRCKIKDNGLQRALASYENLEDHEHEDRLKAVSSLTQLAGSLKKAKEVTASPEVLKYLAELLLALQAEQREITKAQALEARTEATNAKKEAEEKKRKEEEAQEDKEEAQEEEDEGLGVYPVRLMAAFQKLKSSTDVPFEFIVCEAKPYCGLMVAKRITPKHKEELTRLTGGVKHFLPLGTCQFENSRFVFKMEKPAAGLARKLQDSIKNFTGKKLPILVGTETADVDEEHPATGKPKASPAATLAQPAAAPKPSRVTLEKAPEAWHQTREVIEAKVDLLKAALRNAFADEGPELVAEIDKNMKKLDWILDTLDHKLADSLAKAHAAGNPPARQAELANAKTILANYIKFVKSEPMIAHIDANPFGIETNFKKLLTESLTHMAQAISSPGNIVHK